MPHCLFFSPASPEVSLSDDPLPHPSLDGVASSSRNASNSSPTFNLSRELAHAYQTPSYHDICSRIHVVDPAQHHQLIQPDIGDRTEFLLSQVLQPNKEFVQEALSHAKSTTLSHLISTYFQHSENASRLCLNIYQCVNSARHLYTPLFDLFHTLPDDSHAIDESLCNLAFDVFLKLDTSENPFASPESHSFRETQLCFSQLKHKLDSRLRKSRSRVRLLHHATAGPLCSPYLPHSFKKKELTNISQLNAAAKGTFVLNKDLDTIDCLVSRLHTGIKYDKLFIRLGLERGRDVYSIQAIVKHLRKNHLNLTHQLKDLEDHICLWFINVNKARSLLLQEIHLPQIHGNL